MADTEYPRFDEGQTLTAADLNMLERFLHVRDRLVARLTGFGVNGGLGGAVAGGTLTIAPGLAVDQAGEPLVLPVPATLPLPPVAGTDAFDFVDPGTGGFSLVLEASDVAQPAADCGEADCAGHAELHTVGVALRVVVGRVTGTRADFSNELLLTVEPLRLALDSTPVNSYTALRDKVADRLTNGTKPLVSPALVAALRGTSIAPSDTPGVMGYKAGWLNMVLFATLDLLRVRTLLALDVDRTATARPGVVLGWVRQNGATWVFDCAYRHAWEPPQGLTEAFFGGSCGNPAGVAQDELEALLAGYAPPDPAPPGHVDPPTFCPKGSVLLGKKCVNVYYPPKKFPDKWAVHWQIDPLTPIYYPPEPVWKQPWVVYETEAWDVFKDGVIGATPYVNQESGAVKNVLEAWITDRGGVADVRVLDVAGTAALAGYLPSGGFSPSDTIVLTKDAGGKIIATGRVAAVRNTRNVGNALTSVQKVAADATTAVTTLQNLTDQVTQNIAAVDVKVDGIGSGLQEVKTEFQSYRSGTFDVSGYGVRLTTLEGQAQRAGDLGDRVAKAEGQLSIIVKGTQKGVSAQVAQGISEFARTTIEALQALPDAPDAVRRSTADADRARAELEQALGADDPELVTRSTIGVLDTMRAMVTASGGNEELGQRLDAQLRDLQGLLR